MIEISLVWIFTAHNVAYDDVARVDEVVDYDMSFDGIS